MKIILTLIIAGVTLASCTKSTLMNDTTQRKVYIRVESVEPSGESIYSPISVISMK